MRLCIPAGTSIRFEPGDEKEVELVEVSGRHKIYGLNGLTDGRSLKQALVTAREKGFRGA